MEIQIIIIRVLIAFFLGALIGFERQWRKRNAGLRTNALVSLGAALFVLIAVNVGLDDASPTRIASQVVTGIGFLGAGVILKEGFHIRGLNTAATLWCSAAVGALTGMGYWIEASIGAVVIVLAHLSLRPLGALIEQRPGPSMSNIHYALIISCAKSAESSLRAMLVKTMSGYTFLSLQSLSSKDTEEGKIEIKATIVSLGRHDFKVEEIVSILGLKKDVKSIQWEIEKELGEENDFD